MRYVKNSTQKMPSVLYKNFPRLRHLQCSSIGRTGYLSRGYYRLASPMKQADDLIQKNTPPVDIYLNPTNASYSCVVIHYKPEQLSLFSTSKGSFMIERYSQVPITIPGTSIPRLNA